MRICTLLALALLFGCSRAHERAENEPTGGRPSSIQDAGSAEQDAGRIAIGTSRDAAGRGGAAAGGVGDTPRWYELCRADRDCGAGAACLAGVCSRRCRYASDCPESRGALPGECTGTPTGICVLSRCTGTGFVSSNCPAGQGCTRSATNQAICQPVPCTPSLPCAADSECVEGSCRPRALH